MVQNGQHLYHHHLGLFYLKSYFPVLNSNALCKFELSTRPSLSIINQFIIVTLLFITKHLLELNCKDMEDHNDWPEPFASSFKTRVLIFEFNLNKGYFLEMLKQF
ncbi:hypothetical protein BpHYR1_043337 [Brachionus plicatilis]|uniref:Uncharacterized protein n=1 Tax=Brachionus plicatilis TaxID=10195 RepID=A0A3M7QIX5_BRAPC|nr:hypothetical protein BpHYR1_043337 [Brachionus plicatilis]